MGTFSCLWDLFKFSLDLRKAQERELATLDEKSMSSSSGIAEPYLCAMKIEGKNRGGGGTTAVTTACPQEVKSTCMCVKKKERKKVRANTHVASVSPYYTRQNRRALTQGV